MHSSLTLPRPRCYRLRMVAIVILIIGGGTALVQEWSDTRAALARSHYATFSARLARCGGPVLASRCIDRELES